MILESKNIRLATGVLHRMAREGKEQELAKKKDRVYRHFNNGGGPPIKDTDEVILLIRLLWERGRWTIDDLSSYFGKTSLRIRQIVEYSVRPTIITEGCVLPEIYHHLKKVNL